ncbi:peptidoglycan-binding protein [Kitasatospora sp. NPDC091335]|uniref:peptidoglycan-binding protein n=1 Tax=Kitasatospora sp. NPDC091335 TaxID=3364085 RepID=UPI003809755D
MQFVPRADWGAQPSKYKLVAIAGTDGVKIHYEGTEVPPALADDHERCAPRMRALQASHLADTTEDYSDIAYNAVVCPHGFLYEGRGAHRRTGANGNPILNGRHYAVCAMLGSKGLTEPSAAQLGGLRDAIEWLRAEGGAGAEILGHRDGYATSCPGGPLYAWVRAGAPRPDGSGPAPQPTPAPTPAEDVPARYQVVVGGLAYGYGAVGDQVTAVGRALVDRGFGGHYQQGPGPTWTDADTLNYAEFQRSLGYQGTDADGVPGPHSLRELLGTLPGGRAVSLAHVVAAARTDPGADQGHRTYGDEVQAVEQALANEGLLERQWVDGSFGTRTVTAYAAWQRRCGYTGADADGTPGHTTLSRLGETHHFSVTD